MSSPKETRAHTIAFTEVTDTCRTLKTIAKACRATALGRGRNKRRMKAVLLNEGLVRRPRMTEFDAAEIPSPERHGSKAKAISRADRSYCFVDGLVSGMKNQRIKTASRATDAMLRKTAVRPKLAATTPKSV